MRFPGSICGLLVRLRCRVCCVTVARSRLEVWRGTIVRVVCVVHGCPGLTMQDMLTPVRLGTLGLQIEQIDNKLFSSFSVSVLHK